MEIGIYGITGSITAVSGVALARFAVGPSFQQHESQWIEADVDMAQLDNETVERVILEYEQKDGWLVSQAKSLAYVKREKNGKIAAISATCSHLGCFVSWDEQGHIFKCPCHNGHYDANGRVISGPPPAPLRRHPVKVEDGKLLLSSTTVPMGGNQREST